MRRGRRARTARLARRLAWPVAVVAATALAATTGLLITLLVYGGVPDRSSAAPVVAGTVIAVVLGILAAPAIRDALRAALPALRPEPSAISRRIAEVVAQRLPTDDLLRRVTEEVGRGLASPRAELWIRSAPDRLTRVAAVGGSAAAPELGADAIGAAGRAGVADESWIRRRLPQLLPAAPDESRRQPVRIAGITDAGTVLGLVVVGRAPGATAYHRSEDAALADVARILAAILRTRAVSAALESEVADLQELSDELAASRRRLVAAADAELRRIERALRERIEPQLTALAGALDDARHPAPQGHGTGGLGPTLDRLGEDARNTAGDVRNLARDVYPGVLADDGLVAALGDLARRHVQPIDLTVESSARYSPELEAALYFCCVQTLRAIAECAPDAKVGVALHDDGHAVRIEITGDGPGLEGSAALVVDGKPTIGETTIGETTMADRLDVHGGTIRCEASPRAGVTLRIEVPRA
jgi:signal transduction histidine kinase